MNIVDVMSGLLLGLAFGVVLENAGFGSPCKLTAQFRLTDWSVFKVMFTAIVFTSVGLMVSQWAGWISMDNVFVPPALLGAAAIGGALVGAGFAVGGYCPGTSVVAVMSGRLDAIVFLVGLIVGTVVFAGAYEQLEAWTVAGEFAGGDTLPAALGVSDLFINAVMVLAAIVVFIGGSAMERRANGVVTAEQAVEGALPQK
jgi:uncharacterized protein